ncbi:MAG: tyrosine-type recombinase/integrase [Elusimicrobia bacterium]|nr:tyrosine-type recombinase/integrase [Elusimicrobiota bacterium]
MEPWVQRFLTSLRARRNASTHTQRAYQTDLAEFAAFWARRGGGAPAKLSRTHVRAYLAQLQTRMKGGRTPGPGLGRASVLRKVAALRSLCRWLREMGELKGDPFLNVPLPKPEKRLPRFLSGQEADVLLEKGAVGSAWTDLRDRALLELLYSAGLRRAEAAGISVPDLDFLSGTVRVFGKGSRERVVPVGDPALKALRAYLAARPRPVGTDRVEPLWINARGRRLSGDGLALLVRRSAKKAGLLKGLSPHALRHSFATELLGAGCGLRELQEMLGHKNIGTTQVYTHASLERLRETYSKSHPRSTAPKPE